MVGGHQDRRENLGRIIAKALAPNLHHPLARIDQLLQPLVHVAPLPRHRPTRVIARHDFLAQHQQRVGDPIVILALTLPAHQFGAADVADVLLAQRRSHHVEQRAATRALYLGHHDHAAVGRGRILNFAGQPHTEPIARALVRYKVREQRLKGRACRSDLGRSDIDVMRWAVGVDVLRAVFDIEALARQVWAEAVAADIDAARIAGPEADGVNDL